MKKRFDTIKWIRCIRDQMYQETKDMGEKEKIIYHKKSIRQAMQELGFRSKLKISA